MSQGWLDSNKRVKYLAGFQILPMFSIVYLHCEPASAAEGETKIYRGMLT